MRARVSFAARPDAKAESLAAPFFNYQQKVQARELPQIILLALIVQPTKLAKFLYVTTRQ